MADGFRLVGGKGAGEVFSNSAVFNNPVAGMLVGVLVTVLVQSSSTSTSIFITMVAAELLTVKQVHPLVMGTSHAMHSPVTPGNAQTQCAQQ